MTYLNFGQNVLTLLCQLVTIPLDANLIVSSLFYAHRLRLAGSGLSHSMLILISVHMLYTSSMLPYQLYSVLWWRPPIVGGVGMNYSHDVLFWSGISLSAYLVVPNLAVLFLTADRLFTLRLRHLYSERAQQ